ncbi:MAG: aldo/keto reductase [Wenzhouxiangellaceae bacterium]
MQTIAIQQHAVPALGFGTFQLKDATARQMVREALAIGYRHIDTAQIYENEAAVGQGIKDAAIARDEIFLTTKVWVDQFRNGDLQRSVDESLQRLGVDYVDLLLLHWPNPDVPLAETIAALNEVQQAGKTRLIGISNFTCELIDQAVALSEAPLATNQVEYHPHLSQAKVLSALARHGMTLTAYSPLAQGKLMDDETLSDIAASHGVSIPQVALRWLLQQPQVMAIPRSSKPEHARNNFAVNEFTLSDEEMQRIHQLARADGRVINPQSLAPDWD